jgi:glycosyltransferase involved in cell wall biosynthesis
MRGVKVLIVTPFLAFPLAHGARVRTYRLAVELARAGAKVDVLCPWRPGLPPRTFESDGVTLHPHAFLSSTLPLLLPERWVPPLVALSWQPFAVGPRRRLRAFSGYDVIQFELCAHAGWMRRVPAGARIVYSAHNVEIDYASARGRGSAPPSAMLRRLRELERLAVESSELVVTCTQADASRLAELYGASSTIVVPNGYDDELLGLDRARLRDAARASLGIGPDERCVLFVGGPARHNRDAVAYLERELVPSLAGRTTLLVAGRCGGRPSRFARDRATTLRLGFVPDLRPLFAAADVAVNPVAYGSGSSLKLVEYIAAGVPVVTTAVGMRGFEQLRDHVVVSELSGFADAVGAAGQLRPPDGLALEELRWSVGGRRLYEAYVALLQAGESG